MREKRLRFPQAQPLGSQQSTTLATPGSRAAGPGTPSLWGQVCPRSRAWRGGLGARGPSTSHAPRGWEGRRAWARETVRLPFPQGAGAAWPRLPPWGGPALPEPCPGFPRQPLRKPGLSASRILQRPRSFLFPNRKSAALRPNTWGADFIRAETNRQEGHDLSGRGTDGSRRGKASGPLPGTQQGRGT